MKKISLDGRALVCEDDESLLDALLRQQVDIAFGCRQGICQNCMARSLDAPPPEPAQHGLKDVLRRQNYFLSCLCYPQQDMTISLTGQEDLFGEAIITGKRLLNAETLLLTLKCHAQPDYFAGQFVKLRRADGLIRSYSIANSRQDGAVLSFHIRRLNGGRFSEWVHRDLAVGDSIGISEPQGLCYYLPGDSAQNLLLIGTGSGLAPLAGIIKEALQQQHNGNIHLFHGSRDVDGLYWIEEMQDLARQYPQFQYTPCVSRGSRPEGVAGGRAHDVAMSMLDSLKGWRVYLCGHPDMVHQSKRLAFLKGARFQDIYADAFHLASAGSE